MSTQADLEKMARFFKQLDTDQDGFLTLEDFERGCKMINDRQSKLCREPDWNGFLNSIDVNSDKLIDYNEFLTAACDRTNQLSEKNLKIAFNALDGN